MGMSTMGLGAANKQGFPLPTNTVQPSITQTSTPQAMPMGASQPSSMPNTVQPSATAPTQTTPSANTFRQDFRNSGSPWDMLFFDPRSPFWLKNSNFNKPFYGPSNYRQRLAYYLRNR